jgi:hypothetical protein
MNGRKHKYYNVGKYKFVNNRGCRLVDYLLCKNNKCEKIGAFDVDCPNNVITVLTVSFMFNKSTNYVDSIYDYNYLNQNYDSVDYTCMERKSKRSVY